MRWLKALFGAAPAKKRVALKKPKTYAAPTDRAALIDEAMAAYHTGKAHMRDAIERTVRDFKAKPPRAVQEQEALVRVLALHRADADLRKLMGHDLRRYLVLTGIREWMEEGRAGKSATRR